MLAAKRHGWQCGEAVWQNRALVGECVRRVEYVILEPVSGKAGRNFEARARPHFEHNPTLPGRQFGRRRSAPGFVHPPKKKPGSVVCIHHVCIFTGHLPSPSVESKFHANKFTTSQCTLLPTACAAPTDHKELLAQWQLPWHRQRLHRMIVTIPVLRSG